MKRFLLAVLAALALAAPSLAIPGDFVTNPNATVFMDKTQGVVCPFADVTKCGRYQDWNALKGAVNDLRMQTSSFVNVKSYGAVGDGVHDDTSAIQAAIYAVSQSSIPPSSLSSAYRFGGKVVLPKGKYLVTATLYVPAYVMLEGAGRVFFDNGNVATVSASQCPGTVIFFAPSNPNTYAIRSGNFLVSTGALITGTTDITGNDIDAHTHSEVRDVAIRDLTVATNTAATLGGIFLTGASESTIDNVGVIGTFTRGVRVSGSWSVHVARLGVNITNSNAVGFQFYNAANGNSITDSYVSTNTTDGTAYVFSSGLALTGLSLIAEKSSVGFQEDGSSNTELVGLYAESVLSQIISITANGSVRPRWSNIRVVNSPAAVLVDDPAGIVAGELRGLSTYNSLAKILGSTTAYTQLTLWGISPLGGDALADSNAAAIKFIPDAKHTTLDGTQYLEYVTMPNAGAAYHQIAHTFGGTTPYDVKYTPTQILFEDWTSGNVRVAFDFTFPWTVSLQGGIAPGPPAGGSQPNRIFVGTGAPSNGDGANGDWYLRSDGAAGTSIYRKDSGAWVGKL